MNKPRKQAAFISLIAACGNLSVVAGTIAITPLSMSEMIFMLISISAMVFIFFAGVLTLLVGIVLMTRVELSKKALLMLFLFSIGVLAIAAAQRTIAVFFILLWPWSLYKLYQSKTA